MTILRIIAAVVDTRLITLYEESTGKSYEIPQGDPRVQQIVDTVLPLVQQGLVAEFHYEAGATNPYKDFQEKSGGGVKFFRVLKSKLAGLFGSTPPVVEEGTYGALPAPGGEGVESLDAMPEAPTLTTDMSKAVKEIISHAEPVTGPGFSDRHTTDDETMIAVTGTGKDQRVLPGVEKLKGQFAHAAKLGSTQGVQRLIERLTAIIAKRQHSVEDVLRFLEKGDLPVADDGTIIAYKRLYKSGDRYVDPHTRQVKQRVGSYVCLDESLVDKNRRNECSNGLHIGRRQYMGSFSGDVITICKIDPEDVIVVPHGDPNKVRVCGYHIIAELGQAEFKKICSNAPMTDSEKAQSLLARAIRGEHIGRIEEVRITQERGNGIVITPLENGRKPVAKGRVEAPNAMALDDERVAEFDPKKGPEARADVGKVIESVAPAQSNQDEPGQTTASPTGSPRVQQMRSLYASLIATKDPTKRLAIALEAVALKKKAKVGWQTLGLSLAEAQQILTASTTPVPVETPAAPNLASGSAPASSRSARATQLHEIITTSTDPVHRREAARQLLDLKKTSRVSWTKLGMDGTDEWLKGIQEAAAEPAEASSAAPAPEPTIDPLESAVAAMEVAAEAIADGSAYAPDEPETISGAPDAPPAGKFDRRVEAKRLFDIANDANQLPGDRRQALTDLNTLKRKSKVSWSGLGLNSDEVVALDGKITRADQENLVSKMAPVQELVEAEEQDEIAEANEPKVYPDSHAGRARKLFDEGKFGPLWDYKQRAKKGWETLGFTPAEITTILAKKP